MTTKHKIMFGLGGMMTTKHKIMFGFGGMIAIIALISALGYSTLDDAVSGYQEYRRYARLNVWISDVLADFNAAGISMNLFLDGYNEAHIKAAQNSMDEVDKNLDSTLKTTRSQQRIDFTNEIRKKARAYKEGLGKLLVECRRMQEVFRTRVVPSRTVAEESTELMVRNARRSNNAGLLALFAQMGSQVADMRFSMGDFLQSRSEASGKAVLAKAAEVKSTLGQMREFAGRPYTMFEAHGKLTTAFNAWADGLAALIETGAAANAVLVEIRAIRADLSKNIEDLNAVYDRQMNTIGPATNAAMLDGQNVLLGGSAAGLILGVIAALAIILGLVKILRETGVFARALADGDFKAEVKSREKGEIGELLDSMRQIPAVLQAILGDYQKLERHVEAGELETRGDPAAYRGGFAAMIAGTNSILGRFLHIVESIPSPVVMLDRDLKVTWLNGAGRTVCGADYRGKTCKQIMEREDSGTPNDALHRALESLKPSGGENVARPQGKQMDISYTAIPMLDAGGKFASMLQLVTDLTAIRETQRTIRKVADQAAAISNRVAAASEELSAQVEQVSRGAEEQRARVDSTATAMTEMNATVLEVARSAGQAAEQSEETKNKAAAGADLVDKVVQAINTVNTVAAALQTNMQDLGDRAESIGGVMNVISDIADQTNLLALNAAIEAARAGEAGRGFAVVADEVRKLAEKTMSATQEVGANIKAIQQSAHTNIREVGEAAKSVTEATGLANTSGKALAEIVDLAAANSAVVTSIAAAAEEQSATSEEISRSIDGINKIVAETADGMTQSSQAVQELSRMAQELNTVMAELR
ncbi:MAG: methyl-accepting chemotaxis protein [Deltaproteobacteria bacterium]|nr:methyl-accepting chemotaxis protein [Deltaproteobacteria bacterium]